MKRTLFEAPLPAVMFPWTITWTRPLKGLASLIVTVLLVLSGLTLRTSSALVKSVSLCFFTVFVTAAKTWYRPELLAELELSGSLKLTVNEVRPFLEDTPVMASTCGSIGVGVEVLKSGSKSGRRRGRGRVFPVQ